MALIIHVTDYSGGNVEGVKVEYGHIRGDITIKETGTTDSSGNVRINNFNWVEGDFLSFKRKGYIPYSYLYSDHPNSPTGGLTIELSLAILYFKLYKYNEDTKTEELYYHSIKLEPYRYSNGTMTAETAVDSLYRNEDGYYYIDLRNYNAYSPIEYTNSFLFKITANDPNLTDYGSIFLLPNGFMKKKFANWDFKIVSITENTLPDQTMVFYPNTKRLTKADLKKCVVSNPHLMEDEKDESYCPTNITYSTIYNMIKGSNNRDNNYISGVEDVNFYQDKILNIANSASNTCNIKCYIDTPGLLAHSLTLAPGARETYETYYSANAQVKAVSQDNNYVVSPGLQTITMNDNKTITFTCKERTFTYIIEKIELRLKTAAASPTKIIGSWKKNEAPKALDNLEVAVTIYDPVNKGYLSFKDTFKQCTGTGTDKLAHRYMYESIDRGQNTDNDIVWENGNSFYVVSIFFSSTNIYYQFKNNGYYSGGVFRPYVYPEPTNTPSQPGGGSSWGGGDYTVTVIPNGKSVECDLEDNRGNKTHKTITSDKTYNVQSLTVTGEGYWNYSSDSGTTDGPDADEYIIPFQKDSTGRKIKLELVQLW